MWLCLDHDGQAGSIAQSWWRRFIGSTRSKQKITVDMVLNDLLISETILGVISTITVRKSGKYYEIIDYNKPLPT
jgi:hypothetical protein